MYRLPPKRGLKMSTEISLENSFNKDKSSVSKEELQINSKPLKKIVSFSKELSYNAVNYLLKENTELNIDQLICKNEKIEPVEILDYLTTILMLNIKKVDNNYVKLNYYDDDSIYSAINIYFWIINNKYIIEIKNINTKKEDFDFIIKSVLNWFDRKLEINY